MYSYEEALEASEAYFDGDDLAASVFVDKYALRNLNGELLEKTPRDTHRRLAREFARIEARKFKKPLTEEEIFSYFDGFNEIVLQGSPMYGIGNPYQFVSIGNCFVIPPPEDSYLGIMHTDLQITQISSRRGGVGWDVSNLRPENSVVKNAAKTTTGMTSFMKRFSNTIREVGQHGRRGASLQSCSVYHPDILKFINVKRNLTDVTGSNISIKFDDKFMQAVQEEASVFLQWPVPTVEKPNPIVKITKEESAKTIWNQFIDATWSTAEPGAMFIDNVYKYSTTYPYRKFGFYETSSNPCGEQYLPNYASCRLIAYNLFACIVNPFTKHAFFDWDKFKKGIAVMQRIADDMVDIELECIDKIILKIQSDPESDEIKRPGLELWQKIKETAIKDRRTGCGLTALGDTIAALGMRYGSEESLDFAEEMQKQFKLAAFGSSVDMAEELGPFPLYDKDLDDESLFIQAFREDAPDLYERMRRFGRRNMTILTIAPTGSISCLTRTTSGIEPVFMLEYMRKKKGNPGDKNFRVDFTDANGDTWMEFDVVHSKLGLWRKVSGLDKIKDSPYHKSSSHEIDYVARVHMQARLQKHIDNSISTTINLPKDISKKKVSEIYMLAHKLGCKGMTIYRDGSRDGVLVSKDQPKASDKIQHHDAPKRPDELECDVYHITVAGKPFYVLVGLYKGEPYEIFAGRNGIVDKSVAKGKIIRKNKPKCYKAVLEDESEICPTTIGSTDEQETLTRLVSICLRHGVEVRFVCEQLGKIQGDITSFVKGIVRVLKKYIPDGTEAINEKCEKCGSEAITYQEGCCRCASCGNSKCG